MAAATPGLNRRALTIGGVALGALVVFFLATKLFGGGGGGGGGTAASGPTGAPPAASPGADVADPLLAKAVGETFEVFTIRDPFRSLISTAAPGGVPAPGPGDGSGATGPIGGDGATGATGPTGPVPAGSQVALLDVFVDAGVTKARVRVDGTIYTVGVGDAFATNFFVVSLTDACGEFVHADVRFSLCEGQETIT